MAGSAQTGVSARRAAGTSRADPQRAELVPGRKNTTVLIVEDSNLVQQRLAEIIREVPHAVVVGQPVEGNEALESFRQQRPDAVVLDLSLPGINGIDLLAQFKREQPACVVMVLTTYAFTEFRRRCVKLGADHFFDKSTEFERITEVLGAMTANQTAKAQP